MIEDERWLMRWLMVDGWKKDGWRWWMIEMVDELVDDI